MKFNAILFLIIVNGSHNNVNRGRKMDLSKMPQMEETKKVSAEIVGDEVLLELIDNTFSEFNAQLAKIKEESDNIVFDYENESDNKLARSHVRKLRSMKTPIKEAKTKAKKPFLEYGKALDAKEKELITFVNDRIDIHDKPLKEIKEREENRVKALTDRIEEIITFGQQEYLTSSDASKMVKSLTSIITEEFFEEFQENAMIELDKAIALVKSKCDILTLNEKNAAELERLRIESAKKDQLIRDNEIASKAAEKAEFEKKQAIENAERERIEAGVRAEQEKKEAVQAEADRHAAEKAEEKLQADLLEKQEQERKANVEHQKVINNQALQSIIALGFSEKQGVELITAIAKGNIANVSIGY